MQKYAFTKVLISFGTGVLTFSYTYFLGIDFAIFWGVITFYLNFIPNIGSIIAVIPPVIIAFLQYGSWEKVLLTIFGLGFIQMLLGNFIEPKAMGQKLELSPFVVFISLLFWGWLWGIPGMFLSVPLTVGVKIICSSIRPLQPVAILLGGNPVSFNGVDGTKREGFTESKNKSRKEQKRKKKRRK